jgi:hypothetical protein
MPWSAELTVRVEAVPARPRSLRLLCWMLVVRPVMMPVWSAYQVERLEWQVLQARL